ncbi:solute carrier family 12 member 9 [Diabrotica virgifera virgifera]|uniref:Solute carrier family 12 member 9 n=1 Tax=Diabrotica virgifera virgifera TaxID=50390 RepID=A0ABM5K795_DIAVI|nr:solute carrier family 12 member 9 [Diabrotica virgifera virgifera]
MIAPAEGSTNNEPLVNNSSSLRRRISGLFNRDSSSHGSNSGMGYVEFGTFSEESTTRTLGTFAGVFCPVTLSMFSALIFLRMGYIVGNAGLLVTLTQFAIAYGILVFTVMSICAISTNGAVEGGGAYFMISRTLGPEFGGSIGTLFFFANIVSSALYISGCVEGLIEFFGPSGYLVAGVIEKGRWYGFLYGTLLNILNLFICLIGASMFAKTSLFILVLVCSCLGITFFSFFYEGFLEVPIPDTNTLIQNATMPVTRNYTGLSSATFNSNLFPQYGQDYTAKGELTSFATVFGVLFSGVTGIMAGANMSGELKNPGKSIPRGTLSAVGFTFIIYIFISFLTTGTCTKELLQNNYVYMAGVSAFPASVAIGLITATWSASLSNIIGASRVVEALSKDRIFGPILNFIPKGTWKGNPIAAVVLSAVLVQFILLIGSLNIIAQLNSVLFLLSYLATNIACLGLELAGAPNFRPSFMYFTWHTALLAFLGTMIMMFVISPIYAASSILLCLILVIALHLFSPSKEAQWGSISQALIFHQVRKYLLLLDSRKDHVKFWRPQVLLLVNSPRSSCPLIDFVNDLKKGGLYVIGHVETGEMSEEGVDPTLNQAPHWLTLVDHLKVKAFIELTVAKTVREGLQHLMRLSGMGAMKPNTVILGFLDNEESQDFLRSTDSIYQNHDFENDVFPLKTQSTVQPLEYVQMMRDVLRMNKNLCLCRNFVRLRKDARSVRNKMYIDVWPVNFLNPGENDSFDTTSLFMMQLACIVNMVPVWKKLKLRICICDEARSSYFTSSISLSHSERLETLLKKLRIEAELFRVDGWKTVLESHGTEEERYPKSVNTLILQQTAETAVTFIYLPAPPTDNTKLVSFYNNLEIFSRNLPPTIFVHGVSTVTSTTL